MSARKLVVAVLVSACALAFGAASASAAPKYEAFENFCPQLQNPAFCTGATPMATPLGMAADNSTNVADEGKGDIYVASLGGAGSISTVSRFTAAGEPATFAGSNPQITGTDFNQISFGEPPEPTFRGAFAVAVNEETGDFYVTEHAGNVVDEFSPAGEPIASGSFALPAGSNPTGIAVDNSHEPSHGDIYVSEESNVVYKFNQAGQEIGQIPDASGTPYTLAVDAHGDLYVSNLFDNVEEFDAAGTFVKVLDTGHEAEAVAIDPGTGDILAVDSGPNGGYVQPYTEAGVALPVIGSQGEVPEKDSYGLAANAESDDVYLALAGGGVGVILGQGDERGPPTEVETGSAEPTARSVTLHGKLNPGGSARYYFEYGTEACTTVPDPCQRTPELGPVDSETQQSIAVEVTGLLTGEKYHYRLVATNKHETVDGTGEGTFETETALPEPRTEPATTVTMTGAELNGEVNPGDLATEYHFEYGTEPCTTGACTTKTTEHGPIAGRARRVVEPAEITSLQPGTTYHYWLVATNGRGTVHGTERTLTTPPVPASPETPGTTTPTTGSLTAPVAPLIATTTTKPTIPTTTPPKKATKPKTLTRAQKLAKALRECAKKQKRERASCLKQVGNRFAPHGRHTPAKTKNKPNRNKKKLV